MRDPWFPVILIAIVLMTVWLGIVGPLPDGFSAWLQKWQTLAAALVASAAAYIAFRNTSRTLNHSEKLEKNRRNRKHAAVRAVLPLALAQVTGCAERSAHALNALMLKCVGESLPAKSAPDDIVEPLPPDTLKTLAELIEYSDTVDVGIIEATVARIQIHDSRMRSLFQDNHDLSGSRIVLRTEIEGRIIDAASIYAGAAAAFDYARRRQGLLPGVLSWDAVRAALRNMRLWDDEYPRLYEALSSRAALSEGPFEASNSNVSLGH